MLFFIHSIHFILSENFSTIDKNYFKFIKQKILSLLKKDGFIYVKLVKKEWFIKNKPVGRTFLKSLDNAYENILKMKFKIVDIKTNKYFIFMLLQVSK